MALTYPDKFEFTVQKTPEGWGVTCLDGAASGETMPEALRNLAEMFEVTERMEGSRRLHEAPTETPN